MQELITLTMKEQERYEIIKESLRGRIRVKDASLILGLCIRQIYRLRQKVKKEGIKGIIHHSKGKVSHRKMSKK
ncbi:MAG: helix-turn-helix domain-containing protein, partial [Candidatus Omnitrophica bacterium]|nr:helix-turn-helix domain-containing protein [Candidatus Omnitrophota bacterium]